MKYSIFLSASYLCVCLVAGCRGPQKPPPQFDTRALTENEAMEIIRQVLAERNYVNFQPTDVVLSNNARFQCDIRVVGQTFCIEYMTGQEHQAVGALPLPADGSRLYVLRGRTVPADSETVGENIFVFILPSENFVYQFNPTPSLRASVTYQDVDARLRRDLADFLSWYQKDISQR
jgi:hypothetical protein